MKNTVRRKHCSSLEEKDPRIFLLSAEKNNKKNFREKKFEPSNAIIAIENWRLIDSKCFQSGSIAITIIISNRTFLPPPPPQIRCYSCPRLPGCPIYEATRSMRAFRSLRIHIFHIFIGNSESRLTQIARVVIAAIYRCTPIYARIYTCTCMHEYNRKEKRAGRSVNLIWNELSIRWVLH